MEWYWFVDGDVDVIEDASSPENHVKALVSCECFSHWWRVGERFRDM